MEIPTLTIDVRRHLECEISHDIREGETGPDRVRWNSRAIIMLLAHIVKLENLIVHCQIHSGYRDCGKSQMTSDQQALYDEISDRSEHIIEAANRLKS